MSGFTTKMFVTFFYFLCIIIHLVHQIIPSHSKTFSFKGKGVNLLIIKVFKIYLMAAFAYFVTQGSENHVFLTSFTCVRIGFPYIREKWKTFLFWKRFFFSGNLFFYSVWRQINIILPVPCNKSSFPLTRFCLPPLTEEIVRPFSF